LETVWPGEVVVFDPRAGEIRGHWQLRRFVRQNQTWLAERHARIENLLIVFVIAVAVPLLLGFAPRLRVPSFVIEIIVGVIAGPSVLGWVQIDLPVQILAVFGLAFLLFLAGSEIDLRGLRGNLLQVAVLGYLLTWCWGLRWAPVSAP
jgi:hypothetical protein